MGTKKHALVFQSAITPDDYKSQTIFDIFYKRKTPAILMLLSLLGSLTLLVLDIMEFIELPFNIFVLLLVYVAAILGFRAIIGKIVKKVVEPDKISIYNEHTYIVSQMGIHMTGGIEEADLILTWNIISEVFEVQNSFYVYINTAQYLIFPKRDLNEKGERFLREIFQDKLEQNFHRRTIKKSSRSST